MAFLAEASFEMLRQALGQGRLAHAYLITGPQGSGKRRLAMRLSRLVNGLPDSGDALEHPDVHIVEPESKSRRILIEQTRGLEKELQMRSLLGGTKVGMIIDADRLQPNAANAFLKTLEEPPQHSLLILVTAQPEALLDTIISRCIEVPLRLEERLPLTASQMNLLDAVRDLFSKKHGDLASVFSITKKFTELLADARGTISAELSDQFKAEETRYKQTTDSRDWLEDREEFYKALTEARYVNERFALVDTLIQWWADVARQQNGSAQLDLPEYRAATAALADQLSASDVLGKLDALNGLRTNFNRSGVQEQLATEVAFLKVFASEVI